jgi:hypothetical protein
LVEEEWTLDDVAAQRAHWAQFGPPAHIAVAVFAAAWGVKLTRDTAPEAEVAAEARVMGSSIADMAALAHPAGEDTLAASLVIIRKMQEDGG